MRSLITFYYRYRPHLCIDLHSGAGKVVVLPYGYSEYDPYLLILADLSTRRYGYVPALTVPTGELVWWCYRVAEYRTPALLLEIYAGQGTVFAHYNPVDREVLEKVCEEVSELLHYLITLSSYLSQRRGTPQLCTTSPPYLLLLLLTYLVLLLISSSRRRGLGLR